jgi:small subunit ribosomal protein S8
MVNDQLSDFVTRIRNGYMAKKKRIEIPNVKIVSRVAEILIKSGYLLKLKTEENKLFAELKYEAKEPAMSGIERVSRPGARIYFGADRIPKVLGGLGMCVLSTPKGIMADKQAKKTNNGGEVILKIW